MRHLHILILALCALSAVMAGGATTEDNVYQVLTEHGIKYDSKNMHEGMITGMLSTVDPRARLLSTNDINHLNNLTAIAAIEDLPENIKYIKLHGLYKNSGEEIVLEMESNATEHVSGLILDLRSAGGNELDSVNTIINRYAVSNTPLYEITDNSGNIIGDYSTSSNLVTQTRKPLMVLINQTTADASEILAALLKKKDGVMLIGTTTKKPHGLMEVIPFSGAESLYIVTKHVVPIGLEDSFTNGVVPDIVIAETKDTEMELAIPGKVMIGKNISKKAQADRKLMERVANDPVLRRATDILLALKAVSREQGAACPPYSALAVQVGEQ